MSIPKGFYVYIYFDKGQPIYVGKGTRSRAWHHQKHNSGHLGNILRKRARDGNMLQPQIILCDDDCSAIELEIFLISEIGRKDMGLGPLLNLTDGGDGASGFKHSESAKARISFSNSVRKISVAQRLKTSMSLKELYADPEVRLRAGAANKGRVLSDEHRAKMSQSTKGLPKSQETKDRMKVAWEKRRLQLITQ